MPRGYPTWETAVCGVYRIANVFTMQNYVGSSYRMQERWLNHKRNLGYGSSEHIKLQESWNIYGSESFVFEVLEECGRSQLKQQEQYWIDRLDSVKMGYNSAPKSNSQLGYRHRDDAKLKMKEAQRKRFEKPEEIQAASIRAKEVASRADVRAAISKSVTKYNSNPEVREHLSKKSKEAHENNPHLRSEHGERIRDKWKNDPVYREKLLAHLARLNSKRKNLEKSNG